VSLAAPSPLSSIILLEASIFEEENKVIVRYNQKEEMEGKILTIHHMMLEVYF
jgi:hypothetical protein